MNKEEKTDGIQGGKITITPNIGHTQGKFSANYTLEPDKGITDDFITEKKRSGEVTEIGLKYKTLAELDIRAENYSFTNFYNLNDFQLILDNQIALFRSTGQVFTLISFRLDRRAEAESLLTANQLMNIIRLSTDKKDKICLISNNIVVMITREDIGSINKLLSRLKGNLPARDPEHVARVVMYISIFAMKVDDTMKNAEDMLQKLLVNSQETQNHPSFN